MWRVRSRIQSVVVLVAPYLMWAGTAWGQTTSPPDGGYTFRIGGYGEMLYQHFDYGPDQRSGSSGSPPDDRVTVDIPRLVFETEYRFTDNLFFGAEIELEHGGTGSALELEYEEFGEYEMENEKGGEVVLEQFHITHTFSPGLNIRAGHFVVPVGLLNYAHLPTDYFTTVRPEAETALIPTTWHETGAELFGTVRNVSYRMQLVNGLDSSGFSSENWVAGGRQTKFETVKSTSMAYVGRLDYADIGGLSIGASIYRGDSNKNRQKEADMKGIDGHVTIGHVNAVFDKGPIILRGLFLYGSVENADIISAKNSRLSTNIQAARTPVGSAAQAWSLEAGYDVLSLHHTPSGYRLYPFIRYEYYNSMEEVDDGIFADPRFERTVLTVGINFFPASPVVVKADYSIRKLGRSRYNEENTFGLSVGFSDGFFQRQDSVR